MPLMEFTFVIDTTDGGPLLHDLVELIGGALCPDSTSHDQSRKLIGARCTPEMETGNDR